MHLISRFREMISHLTPEDRILLVIIFFLEAIIIILSLLYYYNVIIPVRREQEGRVTKYNPYTDKF